MLELFSRHGAFDLVIRATGDLDVDQHHTVEDVGIALGEAVSAALGTRRGINRAGYFVMPMDETLAVAAIDLGGRVHSARRPQAEGPERRGSAGRARRGLLRRFCAGGPRQCPREGALRAVEPPSRRSRIQGVRARAARRMRERPPHGADAAEHEGASLMIALIDYGAGNLTSVRKGLAAAGAELFTPGDASRSGSRQRHRRPGGRPLRRHRRD